MSAIDGKTLIKLAVTMIISLLGLVLLALFYTPFFGRNLVLWHVYVMPGRGFDVLGFVLPLIILLTCTVFYFKKALPKLIYFLGFTSSFFIAFFSSAIANNRGLMNNPAIISFEVCLIIVFALTPFSVALRKKSIWQLKENYIASLLLGLSCIPLGLIALDFYALPLFYKGVIGGNGLSDGVLLSALYTPLTVTFLFSIFSIILIASRQIKVDLHSKHSVVSCFDQPSCSRYG
jgi:hypothetical protein